jgi:hypothetical protein
MVSPEWCWWFGWMVRINPLKLQSFVGSLIWDEPWSNLDRHLLILQWQEDCLLQHLTPIWQIFVALRNWLPWFTCWYENKES